MTVAGQRAADRQPVGARLLLIDPPLALMAALCLVEILNNLRPFGSAFGCNPAAFGIERDDAIERSRINENAIVAELLPAHGVTPTRNTHRSSGRGGLRNLDLEFVYRS